MDESVESALVECLLPEIEPVVDPMEGVPALLAEAMRSRGFAELTSVQRSVVDADSEGRDLRISSQTGSGKTVAIGLALASHLAGESQGAARRSRGPSVLVLVPTRELAIQVREELLWLYAGVRGLGVEVVMGGTSLSMERRALSRGPRVVVGTPGRTLDHIKTGALACDDIHHVALDESDRMLDMGFREELEAILEQLPSERRTHLVSATFPQQVRRLADRFQQGALHIEGTALGAANLDIQHVAHLVDRRDSYAAIVNLLLLNEGGRCLVFVERRVDVAALATKLSGDGFPVQPFSGELPQAQRTRTMNAFRDGTIKTLVSTDVAARGIDVPDIELVIHADPPADADSYVHRSGRTGRAGRAGRSVSLVEPRAQRGMERLFRHARIESKWLPAPSASKVRKQLRKRFRHQLRERLAADLQPTQTQIDYAKGLLDGRDPAAVVATLIEIAQPTTAREPMEVKEPRAAAPRSDAPRSNAKRGAPRETSQGFVRFSINWGESNGAAVNRVLGHVCRRGEVRSNRVGSIQIGPTDTTFEIEAAAADQFERLVARRDARDPELRIVRADGPAGPRKRTESAPRPGKRIESAPRPGKPHKKKRFYAKR